jgi:hypothetical protein
MFCYFPRLDPIRTLCSALSGLLKHFKALYVGHQFPELLHFLVRSTGGLAELAVENLS